MSYLILLIALLNFNFIHGTFELMFSVNDCMDLIEFQNDGTYGCKAALQCCEYYCLEKRHRLFNEDLSLCSETAEKFYRKISFKSTWRKRYLYNLCQCKRGTKKQVAAAIKKLNDLVDKK
ncbi:hypothetical protein MHBO_004597 [Bonamia ostreae]|uniref:Uncharacterized protein n=1 Tax=Bonamia ostreae TaxID=126728 RepID=A0ABV2AUK2_9EUKA